MTPLHKYVNEDMLLCMRTTIDLPTPLFRRAKAAAATEGVTLREVVVRALEAHLQQPRKRAYAFDWQPMKGALPIPEGVMDSRERFYEYFGLDRKF